MALLRSMRKEVFATTALLLASCVGGVAANVPTLLPELWQFGFLLTIWSHSTFFAVASTFLVWLLVPVASFHRADDFAGDASGFLFMGVYFLAPSMILIGALVGFLAVSWLRLPQLIDVRILYNDPKAPRTSVFNFIGLALLLGPLLAGVAAVTINGNFLDKGALDPGPNTTPETNTIFIVVWSILAGGLIIALIVMVFWESPAKLPLGRRIAGTIQLKYIIALFILLAPSAGLYDFVTELPPPQNNLAGSAVLVGLWILVFVFFAYTWKESDTQIRSVRVAAYFCVVVGASHIFVYAVTLGIMYVVEPVGLPSAELGMPTGVQAILGLSLVVILVYLFIWGVLVRPAERRRRRAHMDAVRARGSTDTTAVGVASSFKGGAKQRQNRRTRSTSPFVETTTL